MLRWKRTEQFLRTGNMATKLFECESCGARGKIILKSEERLEDIVYCPVCSADIYEEEDYEEEE